jgi:Zn-dependent M16 (insulinase) family peptidase
VLPKVGLEDIPADIPSFKGHATYLHHLKATLSPAATNGLIYQQLICELPEMSPAQRALLPLMTAAWTEVGVGDDDYMSTQMRQASLTGGLGASLSVSADVDDASKAKAKIVLSGKALNRNGMALSELIQDTFFKVRFDEIDRLRELISMWRASAEQSLTSNGHGLAMIAASAHRGIASAWAHANSGLLGVKRLKALDDSLNDEAHLQALAQQLTGLHTIMTHAQREALLVGDNDEMLSLMDHLNDVWSPSGEAGAPRSPFITDVPNAVAGQAWVTSTRVHFCAQAHAAVPWNHQDSPLLSVLTGVLRNGYLHPNIREKGGAYGGGASYDADSGTFRFYSYRDPRLLETYEIFDGALAWLLSDAAKPELVEEAVLGVIGAMDKPGSPAGEVKKLFHLEQAGKTHATRMAWRKGVLNANLASLRRVAENYLTETGKTRAVLTNEQGAEQAKDVLGFDRYDV